MFAVLSGSTGCDYVGLGRDRVDGSAESEALGAAAELASKKREFEDLALSLAERSASLERYRAGVEALQYEGLAGQYPDLDERLTATLDKLTDGQQVVPGLTSEVELLANTVIDFREVMLSQVYDHFNIELDGDYEDSLREVGLADARSLISDRGYTMTWDQEARLRSCANLDSKPNGVEQMHARLLACQKILRIDLNNGKFKEHQRARIQEVDRILARLRSTRERVDSKTERTDEAYSALLSTYNTPHWLLGGAMAGILATLLAVIFAGRRYRRRGTDPCGSQPLFSPVVLPLITVMVLAPKSSGSVSNRSRTFRPWRWTARMIMR